MDFSNVISSAEANCFSHGTDSQRNFMDVYGNQSRGPQKHSTDIQLFMIHIDYDNDSSEEEKEATTTSTATSTVSTIASTTVSSAIPTTTVTSVVTTNVNKAAAVPRYTDHA
jgi:hypothetical protein